MNFCYRHMVPNNSKMFHTGNILHVQVLVCDAGGIQYTACTGTSM